MESYRRERITMKTKEELNALKKEVEAVRKKLAELTNEELAQVCGGNGKPDYKVPFYEPTLEWTEYVITGQDS